LRKLDDEESQSMYPSSSVIKIIKSRRMRWAGHAACIGACGMPIGFLWERQKERDH
jgi:hypothetical protein